MGFKNEKNQHIFSIHIGRFSTWRYANYGGMLEHLKDEVKVLDSRQQLLQTMLNVESFM